MIGEWAVGRVEDEMPALPAAKGGVEGVELLLVAELAGTLNLIAFVFIFDFGFWILDWKLNGRLSFGRDGRPWVRSVRRVRRARKD